MFSLEIKMHNSLYLSNYDRDIIKEKWMAKYSYLPYKAMENKLATYNVIINKAYLGYLFDFTFYKHAYICPFQTLFPPLYTVDYSMKNDQFILYTEFHFPDPDTGKPMDDYEEDYGELVEYIEESLNWDLTTDLHAKYLRDINTVMDIIMEDRNGRVSDAKKELVASVLSNIMYDNFVREGKSKTLFSYEAADNMALFVRH